MNDAKGQNKNGEKKMDQQKHPPVPADPVLEGILESPGHVYTPAWA